MVEIGHDNVEASVLSCVETEAGSSEFTLHIIEIVLYALFLCPFDVKQHPVQSEYALLQRACLF